MLRAGARSVVVLVLAVAVVPLGFRDGTVSDRVAETTAGHRFASSFGGLPSARSGWVIRENLRPGTGDWRIRQGTARTIEGFANRVSAQHGEMVTLFVSTPAASFQLKAFRMGYYGGRGARLVWTSDFVPGGLQSAPVRQPRTNMVEARWHPSLHFQVTREWPEGVYLLKLVSGSGAESWIPLTIRNDGSHADLVVQNAVTTWQAYNLWGGHSLYYGPDGSPSRRAKIVSFDRPYSKERGGAGLLNGTERPMIVLVEKLGYDVTYWTDVDLHERPNLLLQHKALIMLGHDEYWSSTMRDIALRARRYGGVNLAFFGGNADYRHMRLAPSPLGRDRREINYRVAKDDPLYGVDNAEVTVNWRDPPIPRPESRLNGDFWECVASPHVPMRFVADAPWLFKGTGLGRGDAIAGLVQGETDRVYGPVPTPETIEILAHSPMSCNGHRTFTDMTYYTTSSGAGIFDVGMIGWLSAIKCDPPLAQFSCRPRIYRATRNLLNAFAIGPAGRLHPSKPNLARFGIRLRHPIRV